MDRPVRFGHLRPEKSRIPQQKSRTLMSLQYLFVIWFVHTVKYQCIHTSRVHTDTSNNFNHLGLVLFVPVIPMYMGLRWS